MRLDAFIQRASNAIFGRRRGWLVVFGLMTLFFAASLMRLSVDAGFNKMVPLEHRT